MNRPSSISHLKTVCQPLEASQPSNTSYHHFYPTANHTPKPITFSAHKAHNRSSDVPRIPQKTYCHFHASIGRIRPNFDHDCNHKGNPNGHKSIKQQSAKRRRGNLCKTPAATDTSLSRSTTSQFPTSWTDQDITHDKGKQSFLIDFAAVPTHIQFTSAQFQPTSQATTRTVSGQCIAATNYCTLILQFPVGPSQSHGSTTPQITG